MSELARLRVDLPERVQAAGVVAIVRTATAGAGLATSRILLDAGMDVVEVSLVTPGALDVITTLVGEYPDQLVGAGTVMTGEQAKACIDAGARLLVSPTIEPHVLEVAQSIGVLAIPGANTPTECVTAARLGAPLIKLFPASTWSPASVADLRSSLPDLRLIPTGGIRLADAVDWYRAGVAALGIGSALTSGTAAQCRDRARQLQESMARARG